MTVLTALSRCVFPECTRPGTGPGARRGYCAAHYQNLLSCGHPGGARMARRDGLQDAAIGLLDAPGPAAYAALVSAAVAYAVPWLRGSTLPADAVYPPPSPELLRAAVAFADFDAEAPLAGFTAAARALELAALELTRLICRADRPQERAA